MKNYFPENLKHLRVQSGMTQEKLAKKMDKDYIKFIIEKRKKEIDKVLGE